MRKYYSLYGQLLSKQRLYEAFRHVKRNKGAAGIDGQSLSCVFRPIVTAHSV